MSNIDLSIVVPAYNEEQRILPTLQKLFAHLVAQPLAWEIVVVDDGSIDRTCGVVTLAMATIPNLRLVRPRRTAARARRSGAACSRRTATSA
jgi:dolichyl-phosphate beta-glucosyltransferase